MNEAETRAELIDPALKASGWGDVEGSRVRREVIAPGRLDGGGRRAKADIADYVLVYKNHKLAVIEAKKRSLPDTEGVGQAKRYAGRLQARFAFSTNGEGIYRIDMHTGEECYVDAYPGPEEMWDHVYAKANVWRDSFAAIPFEDKGGSWEARYYQHNAINKALETLADGKDRILLTLATGTGKTFIAFQLAWKLFQSRWNAKDWREGKEPSRRPRILFLADRNILADQAYNSFSAFPEDALVRIDPGSIRKKGGVPKNGSVFFTIFQTFMSGTDEQGNPSPSFGDYPPDFFDFIVIDECHRGGANDQSTWRAILEYFSPAVQLGLTATPKRSGNVDTYAYFGEPVSIRTKPTTHSPRFLRMRLSGLTRAAFARRAECQRTAASFSQFSRPSCRAQMSKAILHQVSAITLPTSSISLSLMSVTVVVPTTRARGGRSWSISRRRFSSV